MPLKQVAEGREPSGLGKDIPDGLRRVAKTSNGRAQALRFRANTFSTVRLTAVKALLLAFVAATPGLAEDTNFIGMKLVSIQPGTLRRGIGEDEIHAHAEKFTYVLHVQGYFLNQGEYGSGNAVISRV